jgi:hypothetical protein
MKSRRYNPNTVAALNSVEVLLCIHAEQLTLQASWYTLAKPLSTLTVTLGASLADSDHHGVSHVNGVNR